MGSYTQVITNAGEDLIAQALEGETLIFTEVATSASVIEGTLEMIKAVSELKDIKQTVIPAAATKIGSSTVQVSSTFTNEEITEEYDVQTVGLYAKIGDSEQKLFALAKALKASEMTEKSEGSATSLVFNFNMTIQQASELTISIIPGGALPSEVFYSIFPGLGTPSLDNAKNILQVNAKGTWEYITAEDMKASTDEFGFVKLCDSSAVTDSTGLALPATEKNASIEGTLAYQLSQLKTDLKPVPDVPLTILNSSNITNYSSGSIKYCVKNGICYLSIHALFLTVAGDHASKISGLPVPLGDFFVDQQCEVNGLLTGSFYNHATEGAYIHYVDTNLGMWGSCAYPVSI